MKENIMLVTTFRKLREMAKLANYKIKSSTFQSIHFIKNNDKKDSYFVESTNGIILIHIDISDDGYLVEFLNKLDDNILKFGFKLTNYAMSLDCRKLGGHILRFSQNEIFEIIVEYPRTQHLKPDIKKLENSDGINYSNINVREFSNLTNTISKVFPLNNKNGPLDFHFTNSVSPIYIINPYNIHDHALIMPCRNLKVKVAK